MIMEAGPMRHVHMCISRTRHPGPPHHYNWTRQYYRVVCYLLRSPALPVRSPRSPWPMWPSRLATARGACATGVCYKHPDGPRHPAHRRFWCVPANAGGLMAQCGCDRHSTPAAMAHHRAGGDTGQCQSKLRFAIYLPPSHIGPAPYA